MATYVNTKHKNPNKFHTIRYMDQGRQKELSFRTKTEAMNFKAKFEHDSREHIFVDPKESSIKFRDAAERYLENRTGAASSEVAYRRVLRLHINPVMGDRSLRHVAGDRYALETFLKTTLPNKGLGASMVKSCYVIIRAIVNDAVKAGKLTNVRINSISIPPVPVKAQIVWPEWKQLLAMSDAMGEYGTVLWLMRGCGLRIGEALAVRWENFKDGQLRITQQMYPNGTYGPMKHRKEEDFRDVPVPAYVMHALSPDDEDMEDRYGYVFPDVNRQQVTRLFNKARDTTSLDPAFTPHTLRHIFASVSLSNRVPITDVSAWLGHRDINMTYAIYGHLVPSSWATARDVLDQEFVTWKGSSA